ncbi:unnamed protein product [Lactuca saligna]|uniref:SWIM-type domain-containing protein n=1 Tax=Lactuca saligna TaxID=75948 RepID=A0AA35Y4X8_LACSI|nr:unnamed protein product [Lactuca saligna]
MSTHEFEKSSSYDFNHEGHKSFRCSAIEISESSLIEYTKASASFNDSAIEISKSTLIQHTEGDKGKSTIDKEELYHPNVPADLIPKKGETVSTVDEGIEMYRTYGKAAGFGIRLGSTTTYGDYSLRKKHERKSYSKVTGCMAMIGFDRNYKTNTITVYAFEEAHNHPLTEFNEESLCSHNHRLSISDQELIFKASTLNIGATKAHKIRASLKGGYDHLPATKNDFKNFWRDYTNIVGPNDAQCVVDQLIIRRDNYPNFHFEYKLNDEELSAMFWVDETGKENYSKFSDVISMDATYRTNRYNMIFVPFTAINNHEKTINVGAGLISDETIESYSWLLKDFLSAHKKKPTMILTDMDPALTSSISKELQGCTHRLCMWHIMSKMPSKIDPNVVSNSDFKKRINQLVWSMNIEPSEFECQWDMMLDEFDLRENKWLDDMFNKRHKWIPSYFRDIPMCGLMKTTSRSESSNSFFNVFSSATNLLVNFMFKFDTALSKQRHEQKRLDIASRDTSPQLLFAPDPLKIEKHASLVYTREAFLKVQKQIKKAFYQCFQKTSIIVNGFQECTIVYKEVKSGKRPEFKVSFNAHEQTIDCACLHFQFFGILCSHAFRVLIDYNIFEIPQKYILDRWKKNILDVAFQKVNHRWQVCNTNISNLLRDAFSYYEKCIDTVVHDKETLQELVNALQELSVNCGKNVASKPSSNPIKEVVENVIGLHIADDIKIKVPSGIKTKGSGKRNRIKSAAEKAIAKSL